MISHNTANWPQTVPPIRVVDTRETQRRVERQAHLAARGYANVLITSERGVHPAALARLIHDHSDRATRGFATLNCKDIPDLLVESALFGHVQGSFHGAYRDKAGLLESVPGGSIFLDEVDALSVRTQGRLLRYLETGEYLRIGGTPVQMQPWLGVRVIASTTGDLQPRLAAGLFLNDLYIRLSVHRLPVRPRSAGAPVWRRQ
jgi:DNA-binding NtrC family response regulator